MVSETGLRLMPNRKDWQPEDTQVETAAMALRAQQNAPVESRRGQCDCRPLLEADSCLAEVRIPADGLRDVARRPLSFP